jgi:hypothetical protein
VKSARTTLALAVLCGCWGHGAVAPPTGDAVQLGSLAFEVPSGWQRSDVPQPGVLTSVWTPDDRANSRKESITVIQGASPNRLDDKALESLLAGSQAALADSKVSRVEPVMTDTGWAGFSITVEFTPQRVRERYRRKHVVLRPPGGGLVHVIYTARTADPERRALETVLGTIHPREGAS